MKDAEKEEYDPKEGVDVDDNSRDLGLPNVAQVQGGEEPQNENYNNNGIGINNGDDGQIIFAFANQWNSLANRGEHFRLQRALIKHVMDNRVTIRD